MLGLSNLLSVTLQHYIFFSILIFFLGSIMLFLSMNYKALLTSFLVSLHGLFLLASSFFLFTNSSVFLFFLLSLSICIALSLMKKAVCDDFSLEVKIFQEKSARFLFFLSSFLFFELLF